MERENFEGQKFKPGWSGSIMKMIWKAEFLAQTRTCHNQYGILIFQKSF